MKYFNICMLLACAFLFSACHQWMGISGAQMAEQAYTHTWSYKGTTYRAEKGIVSGYHLIRVTADPVDEKNIVEAKLAISEDQYNDVSRRFTRYALATNQYGEKLPEFQVSKEMAEVDEALNESFERKTLDVALFHQYQEKTPKADKEIDNLIEYSASDLEGLQTPSFKDFDPAMVKKACEFIRRNPEYFLFEINAILRQGQTSTKVRVPGELDTAFLAQMESKIHEKVGDGKDCIIFIIDNDALNQKGVLVIQPPSDDNEADLFCLIKPLTEARKLELTGFRNLLDALAKCPDYVEDFRQDIGDLPISMVAIHEVNGIKTNYMLSASAQNEEVVLNIKETRTKMLTFSDFKSYQCTVATIQHDQGGTAKLGIESAEGVTYLSNSKALLLTNALVKDVELLKQLQNPEFSSAVTNIYYKNNSNETTSFTIENQTSIVIEVDNKTAVITKK